MPKNPTALQQESARRARQAAALRANLARRKDQQRQQTVDAQLETGPVPAKPASITG